MNDGVRYEINHEGQIVPGTAALSSRLNDLVRELFSQFGWEYQEEWRHSAHRKARLANPAGDVYHLDLFTANIRNEKRSPYEKKIQLNKEDPRLCQNAMPLILGFYVYQESDGIEDAVIVGYPVDASIHYDTNPSLRGTFVNGILYQAKIYGICIDEAKKMVSFRPEFIFYYLNQYRTLHGYDSVNPPRLSGAELLPKSRQLSFAYNRIVVGAPGTGKSYRLGRDAALFGERMERVTFHPNYSYAQFVGAYKPIQGRAENEIYYAFVPGPFMRVYTAARKHPGEPYLLLIEEINRANVSAVFGDVFQLLDRKNGVSEYEIAVGEDMRRHLKKELCGGKSWGDCSGEEKRLCLSMQLPDNLYIWATMNSADQGVFPMDTAFKRRWDFEYIGIDEGAGEVDAYPIPVGMAEARKLVNWNALRMKLNNLLMDCRVNEDKLLGPFFLSKETLARAAGDMESQDRFVRMFENKVMLYLFEDVMKMRPQDIFQGYAAQNGRMVFSEICRAFEEMGEAVFGFTLPAMEET